ncbi:kunitz trypsin inhibitor 2 [Cajanus cajan]|uniref:Miraculin n=1 Tax=Cajanus cajan TaxID=3821 RepID=A0A151TW93_CAJCA|nr:kunitz trypsin inhibitor 2 [Cajanus cajan]KYP71349.1 Miraculin [Cajanus cajan]
MKFSMAVPLCLSLLLALNTHPLLAAEPEAVVDKQGEPLRPGVGYYVFPLWADEGGLSLGPTRNKTCPLDVIRDPSFIGLPLTFSAPGFDYIPTLTDLKVDFPVSTICVQSNVWRLRKEGAGFWFVSADGNPNDITSKFKIERLEGEHAYEIYSFKFCPSVPGTLCAPVGTFVDTDGTKVMAVGDNIEPYYVRFQKASVNHEKNQAFSIV